MSVSYTNTSILHLVEIFFGVCILHAPVNTSVKQRERIEIIIRYSAFDDEKMT